MRKSFLVLFVSLYCISPVCGQTNYEQLFETACTYLENGRIAEGEPILLDMEENEDVPERIRQNATVVLSNYYVGQNLPHKAKPHLLKLSAYVDKYPDDEDLRNTYAELKQYYVEQKWEEVPVVERLKGTWVSTEVGYWGAPALMMKVVEHKGQVEALIETDCLIYDLCNIWPVTTDITIQEIDERGYCEVYFGDREFIAGNPELAKSVANNTRQLGIDMKKAIATQNRYKPLSSENILGQTAVNLGEALGMALATKLSVSKTHYHICCIRILEEMPGIAKAEIHYTHTTSRSDGRTKTEEYKRIIPLYKIERSESIRFATQNGHFMGAGYISDTHKFKHTECSQINEDAYKKVHSIVQQRVDDMLNYNNIAQSVEDDFKYSPKGMGYIENLPIGFAKPFKYTTYFYFTGIYKKAYQRMSIDRFCYTAEMARAIYENNKDSNAGNTFRADILWWFPMVEGVLSKNANDDSSIVYIGEFEKNKFHGNGALKEEDEQLGQYVYKGSFTKGKKDGEGTTYYSDGRVMEQVWKKGKLKSERRIEE